MRVTRLPSRGASLQAPRVWLYAVITLLLFAASSLACNVPVFRYALERWELHPYEVTIVHCGPLSEKHKQLVAWLQTYADKDSPAVGDSAKDARIANIEIRTFDLMSATALWADPVQAALLPAQQVGEPRMLVHYPQVGEAAGRRAWSASFTPENAKALLLSPARHEISRRLVGGQSAVWLLIESGDKKKDDAAFAVLEKELARLQKTLQLPTLTDTPKDKLIINTALRIEFSTMRLPRDRAAEVSLLQMLLNSEEDLQARSDPIVFAVFGRGIALPALVGKGIKAREIENWAGFLIGACGCESRKLNPGTDLLMTMDWDGVLKDNQILPPEVSPLLGLSGFNSHLGTSAENVPGDIHACPSANSGWLDWLLGQRLLLAAGAGFVLIALVSFFFRVRSTPPPSSPMGEG